MAYEPLHHKYRPQTFASLVGQDAVAKTLSSAVRSHRIAPAYLFAGPRGTGKTSSARILAKSLNCLQGPGPTDQPCGVCEVCRAIASGSALDVIEIDAASNTGVDNIRDVIERAQFAPVQCRYKVYVIDECHMLSVAAFNALLKTLEEPPARVVFVLATTDPQRVLPTIISRCQRFDFRRIALEAMVQHLRQIATQENINIAADALQLVAQVAQGGLRDAESLLDQLSLLPGPITREQVWDLVGAVPERDLIVLLGAIAANNPESVLEQVRYLMDRGREPLIVLQNLAGFYRDLLIAKTAPQRQDLVCITSSTWAELCTLAQEMDVSAILTSQQHLRACEGQIKSTTQPRLWLEVTLLGLLPSGTTLSPSETGLSVTASPAVPPASRQSTITAIGNGNRESTTSLNVSPFVVGSSREVPERPSVTTSPSSTNTERLEQTEAGNISTNPSPEARSRDVLPPLAIETPLGTAAGDTPPTVTEPQPPEAKQNHPLSLASNTVETSAEPPQLNVTLKTDPADVKQTNLAVPQAGALEGSANYSTDDGLVPAADHRRTPNALKQEVLSSALQQAELEQTWQQLLTHLHPLSRALLKEHGKLLIFGSQEAKIGITSQNLIKIAQSRLPDIEATFIKLFNRKVRVSLKVVPAGVEAPPAQSTISNPPSPAHSGKAAHSTVAPTTTPERKKSWSSISPTEPNETQASQEAVSLIPEAVVETLVAQDKPRPPGSNMSSQEEALDSSLPSWQEDDEVLRAAKSLAQFFNGEIVTQETQTSEPALEHTQSKRYDLSDLMNASDETDADELDDIPF